MDVRAIGWSGKLYKSPLSLVRLLLVRSGPWQARKEAQFRAKRPAWAAAICGLNGRSGSGETPAFEHGKFGCYGLGLRRNLLSTEASRLQRAAVDQSARTAFDFPALRVAIVVARREPCRLDRRNLPMPIGHAML